LVKQAGLATQKGRLVVDPMLTVPAHRVLKLLVTPDARHWPEIPTSDAVAAVLGRSVGGHAHLELEDSLWSRRSVIRISRLPRSLLVEPVRAPIRCKV
jgi:hypothetical protein